MSLPTGECSGVPGGGRCQVANVVTDIAIKESGGVGADVPAGTVIAAVAWRAGRRKNSDGSIQSEHNGLYRSTTGAPNTFVRMNASGFTPQERIGRVEFGPTTGSTQDKDYLYAIVQDAVLLNGGIDVIDAPENFPTSPVAGGTVLNGVYVSKDFGATWTLMADDNVIAKNPATGTALHRRAGHRAGRSGLVQPLDLAGSHACEPHRRPDAARVRPRGDLAERTAAPDGRPVDLQGDRALLRRLGLPHAADRPARVSAQPASHDEHDDAP